MFNTPLLQRIFFGLAIVTTFGIVVHDTKFDQAVALALPVATISFGISHMMDSGASHTHIERATFAQTFTGTHRMMARDDRYRYSPKNLSRQSSPFGDSLLSTLA